MIMNVCVNIAGSCLRCFPLWTMNFRRFRENCSPPRLSSWFTDFSLVFPVETNSVFSFQCLSVRPQPTPSAGGVCPLAVETASPRPRCRRPGSSCAPTATTTFLWASTSSSTVPLETGPPICSSTRATNTGPPSRATRSLAPQLCTAACPPSWSSRCPAAAPMATWWSALWGGGPGAAPPPSVGWARRAGGLRPHSGSPGESRTPPGSNRVSGIILGISGSFSWTLWDLGCFYRAAVLQRVRGIKKLKVTEENDREEENKQYFLILCSSDIKMFPSLHWHKHV